MGERVDFEAGRMELRPGDVLVVRPSEEWELP